MPVTEKNKVLMVANLISDEAFNPKYKYLYQGLYLQTQMYTAWGWFAKNHPQIKNSVHIFPDSKIGHMRADIAKKCAEVFGPALPEGFLFFYPPDSTDFSVVGTKLKTLNPQGYTASAGGIQLDGLCFKAAWQAGYKGMQWAFVPYSEDMLAKVIPVEAIEGMISVAYPIELESPPPVAKELKDAYITKYGKWDNPAFTFGDPFIIMTEGIKQANSIDTDKVTEVMSKGMRFEGIMGSGKMISRPDQGNSRTVDLLYGDTIKQTVNGKAKIIVRLTTEEAYEFNKKFFGWK